MLSSRSHHNLFADKENGVAATTLRKPASSYTSSQAATFKTPGFKQGGGAQNGAKTGLKPQQTLQLQQNGGKGKGVAQTVAMEPGARVLGAKDANNRQKQGQTAMKNNKGKGKEGSSADCSEMEPKVLFKDVLATRDSDATSIAPPTKLLSKTPAKNTSAKPSSNPAFKTPSLTARKATRTPRPPVAAPIQNFSIFKTPSPGLLNRKRKGGATPPHLQFDGFVRPAGLRDDGDFVQEQEEVMEEPPSLLDLLQAHLDQIDEEQEVEYAGSSAICYDEPYETDFAMPVYSDLRIGETCFFPCYAQRSGVDSILDDGFLAAEVAMDAENAGQLPPSEWSDIDPPLFPELAGKPKQETMQSSLKPATSKSGLSVARKAVSGSSHNLAATPKVASRLTPKAPVSSRAPSVRSVSSLISSTSTARPTSTAPTSRIHSRAGSVTSISQAGRSSVLRGVQPKKVTVAVEGMEGVDVPDTELELTLD